LQPLALYTIFAAERRWPKSTVMLHRPKSTVLLVSTAMLVCVE
jgi:hypothetical protein